MTADPVEYSTHDVPVRGRSFRGSAQAESADGPQADDAPSLEAQRPGGRSLRSLRRVSWIVFLAMLLAAGAGYWVSARHEPVYAATATLMLLDPSSSALGGGLRGDDVSLWVSGRARAATYAGNLQKAASSLGDGTTADQLADNVSVAVDDEEFTLSVSARGASPRTAADRANAVVAAYGEVEQEQIAAAVDAAAQRFQERSDGINKLIADATADLTSDPGNRSAASVLTSSIDGALRLESSAADAQEEARLGATSLRDSTRATPPTSPVSPRPFQDGAVSGLAAGLLVSGALLQRGSRRRNSVHDAAEAAQVLDLPLVAQMDGRRLDTGEIPPEQVVSSSGFAVATLRLELGSSGGIVLVTSPDDLIAKRRVADELAAAAERSGWWEVVVVDCVGTGESAAAERSAGMLIEDMDTTGTQFRTVPIDEMSAEQVQSALTALRADSRLVVVQGPLLRRSADLAAAILGSDRVLVVVREGSSRQAVSASRDVLVLLRARVLGFVFLRGGTVSARRRDTSPAA